MTETVMYGWSAETRARYGREIVRFNHRLAETGLFEDEALVLLLEQHPRELTDVLTMQSPPPPDRRWVAGEAHGLDGVELLTAVRDGRLWLNLRRGMNLHDEYRLVFEQLMNEFAKATGVRILGASGGILLSSPRLGIFYHCDSTETMLWHVRGEKTMLIYPAAAPHLPDEAYEGVILKENLSDLPYRPELEAEVTPVRLSAGDAVSWPLHGPHRVLNGDSFNVSVSIEYKTLASTFTNGVFYANGVLRRRFGLSPEARAVPEALKPAYWAASKALKLVAPKTNALRAHPRCFDVKLDAPHCIAWRDGYGPETL